MVYYRKFTSFQVTNSEHVSLYLELSLLLPDFRRNISSLTSQMTECMRLGVKQKLIHSATDIFAFVFKALIAFCWVN